MKKKQAPDAKAQRREELLERAQRAADEAAPPEVDAIAGAAVIGFMADPVGDHHR